MSITASFWVIIVRLFMFLQSQDSKKRSVLRKLQSQPPTVYTPQPHSWDNPLPIWAVTPSPATWDPVYLQQVRTDHIDQSEQRTDHIDQSYCSMIPDTPLLHYQSTPTQCSQTQFTAVIITLQRDTTTVSLKARILNI